MKLLSSPAVIVESELRKTIFAVEMEKRWDLFIQYLLIPFLYFHLYPFGSSCISLVFLPRFTSSVYTFLFSFFLSEYSSVVVGIGETGIEIDFANKLKRDQTAVYSRIFDKDFLRTSCLFSIFFPSSENLPRSVFKRGLISNLLKFQIFVKRFLYSLFAE